MPYKVASVKAEQYEYEIIRQAVDRVFSLLEFDKLIKPGMKVVLKPNLLMKCTPEQATTTHPFLVSAVAEKVVGLGAGSVLVAESSGGPYTKANLNAIYAASGLTEASREHPFSLNQDFSYQEVPFDTSGSHYQPA